MSAYVRPLIFVCFSAAVSVFLSGCCLWVLIFPDTDGLSVALTTQRYQLFNSAGGASDTIVRAVVTGGKEPYVYAWSVTDPTGADASSLLDATDTEEAVFTGGSLNGPYVLQCVVTDSNGASQAASLILQVGSDVGLDVTTERVGVIAGGGPQGQTTIHLTPQSGTPPFSVSWTTTGPNGQIDNSRLDVTDPFAPVFTSTDVVGTYTLTATIVDALGARSVKSVIVIVGQILGLDVISSRTTVLPGGGADGLATLLATPIGGREPYEYEWEILGPDGATHNELLWDATVRSPNFESSSMTGVFVARCAVTDADGTVLLGSTAISVGQGLAIDITSNRLSLPTNVAGEDAVLSADIRGGQLPIYITWSVVGPNGADATDRLSSTTNATTTFTPSADAGAYLVRCAIADADGVTAADSLTLSVGTALGATIVADRTSLAAGGGALGQATLQVETNGGVTPYSYAWSVIDPAGQPASDRLNSTSAATVTFTSAADVGAYAVVCAVTDADGAVATDLAYLTVGQPLNVDVAIDKQPLVAGGGVSGQGQLIATVTGGATPYSYQWAVTDPSNAAANGRLSDTQVATPVFTSDATVGAYRLSLTVTDALGVVFIDSTTVAVEEAGAAQTLGVDVDVNRSPVPPFGASAVLTATTIGGAAPLTYAWTLTDPSGATDNSLLNSTTASTVTFTSSDEQGAYRARCVVTDNDGVQAIDSVQFSVSDEFSLDLTAAVAEVAPGGAVSLFANRIGGSANFTYTWTALDETGTPAGAFASGSTGVGTASQTAADDVTNTWTAPVGGSGGYRIFVDVMDASGAVAVDSASVVVSIQQSFMLDVTADRLFVAPGDTVNLTADRTGGTTTFDYAWTARDSSGAAAGALGAANQNGLADDATNTWTAPSGVGDEGTYRISCTVTDSVGRTATDTTIVEVTTTVMQNYFPAPVAADTTGVLGSTFISGAAGGAAPGQQITAGLTSPSEPRNVVITITDQNNSITTGTARITGLNARGVVQSEAIAVTASSGGGSTTVGAVPFTTVTSVELYGFSAVTTFPPVNADKISVGRGAKFGLTGVLTAAADVLYINEGGTVVTSGYTVDVTAGQQSVTFATAPNGVRNYIVVFRAY